MKKLTPWFIVLSLVLGTPAFALAEETGTTDQNTISVGADASMSGSMGGGMQGMGGDTQKPPMKPLPPRNGQPIIPVKTTLMMEHKVMTGATTTGKPILPRGEMMEKMQGRMENGTSGRPLPEGMKERMMEHGSGTDRFASGTPKMMERMKLLKDGRMDRKVEAAKAFLRQSGERAQNAIDRLTKLADRLGSAHEKMKAKGVNVDAAAALLVTAKVKIGDAQVALDAAKVSIEATQAAQTGSTTGEISDASRQAVKDAMKSVKDALEAAQKALVESLKATKVAGGMHDGDDHGQPPHPMPTSTGTTTP